MGTPHRARSDRRRALDWPPFGLWTNTSTDGSIDARMSHRVIACVFTREKDYGEMVTLFELVDHRSREEHTHYC